MSTEILIKLNKIFGSNILRLKQIEEVSALQQDIYNLSIKSKQYIQDQIRNFAVQENNQIYNIQTCIFLASLYAEYFYDEKIDPILEALFRKLPNSNLKNDFIWNLVSLSFRKGVALEKLIANIFSQLVHQICPNPLDILQLQSINQDNKTVLITTSQLLNTTHSPTRLVLDFYDSFKKLGFNPIIVVLQIMPRTKSLLFLNPYRANFIDVPNGSVQLNLDDYQIKAYFYNGPTLNSNPQTDLLNLINELRPEFMLSVGGYNVYQEFIAAYVPCVLITTSAMLTPSPNAKLVSLSANLEDSHKKALQLAGIPSEKYRMLVQLATSMTYLFKNHLLEKPAIGFSNDDIVLALVGNRLDSEIGPPELDFMRSLVEDCGRINFVIVGKISPQLEERISKSCLGKVSFTGSVNDIGDILTAADFLINTKRTGGGLTATLSLGHGILVYTIAYGDVSRIIPNEFQSPDYAGLKQLIEKNLGHDRQVSKNKAHTIFSNFADFTQNLNKIISDLTINVNLENIASVSELSEPM
jgi:hypothetical protein